MEICPCSLRPATPPFRYPAIQMQHFPTGCAAQLVDALTSSRSPTHIAKCSNSNAVGDAPSSRSCMSAAARSTNFQQQPSRGLSSG